MNVCQDQGREAGTIESEDAQKTLCSQMEDTSMTTVKRKRRKKKKPPKKEAVPGSWDSRSAEGRQVGPYFFVVVVAARESERGREPSR